MLAVGLLSDSHTPCQSFHKQIFISHGCILIYTNNACSQEHGESCQHVWVFFADSCSTAHRREALPVPTLPSNICQQWQLSQTQEENACLREVIQSNLSGVIQKEIKTCPLQHMFGSCIQKFLDSSINQYECANKYVMYFSECESFVIVTETAIFVCYDTSG